MTTPTPPPDHDPSAPPALRQPVAPLAPPPGSFEDIRDRARARRRNRVLWTGVALAGCVAAAGIALNVTGHSAPSTVAVSSSDTPGQTTEDSAATRPDSATPHTSAPAPAAEPTAPKAAQGPTTCRTADLKITLGRGEGAAGSQYRPLQITNNGSAACSLFGFPGVSIVDAAGHQVGKPADRDGSQARGKVVLKPGQRESVTLRIVDAANYGSACKLTDGAGIRVYPPGEKQSVVVPVTGLTGCASSTIETLTVTSYGVH
jgi:hypothetical protein